MYHHFRTLVAISFLSLGLKAQTSQKNQALTIPQNISGNLYIDFHHFGPGKVTFEAVSEAHKKDLAIQGKYGVEFINFWFDESRGNVYCLVSSPDSESIRKTHAEAHGLLPERIYLVQGGSMAKATRQKNYFLDMHVFGSAVSAQDVAAAHQKDLGIQKKYGVNFISYWVNEKEGIVMCLAQAPDSAALVNTHKEAHGLIPVYVEKVRIGK